MAISSQMMRGILDSIATRLDEARDMSRYMTGLLVFLGLLGTFWGLIETVGSVGNVINTLKPGGDAGAIFESLKEGLAAPLSGMGISFSSSLFGLAGSLVLGFLDLQTSQAQNRFYTELEDWLSTTVRDLGVRPRAAGGRAGTARCSGDLRACDRASAGGDHAKAGRTGRRPPPWPISPKRSRGWSTTCAREQQMIRDWVDSQAQQHRDIRRLLEILVRENVNK